jgi:hypothetical protein
LDQGKMAGSFDGACKLALVFGAGTSLAARTDLAVFSDEAAHHIHLLIVNHSIVVGAE